jgi:hypothetical protein
MQQPYLVLHPGPRCETGIASAILYFVGSAMAEGAHRCLETLRRRIEVRNCCGRISSVFPIGQMRVERLVIERFVARQDRQTAEAD